MPNGSNPPPSEPSHTSAETGVAPHPTQIRLTEYGALRGEILQRMYMRQQTLNLALVAIAAILTFADRSEMLTLAFLAYPWLAMALGIEWAQHDRRIGHLGRYIKDHIEAEIPELGFEQHIRRRRILGRTEYSALGVFGISDLLAIVLAWAGRGQTPQRDYVMIGVAINVVVMLLTGLFLIGRSGAGWLRERRAAGETIDAPQSSR